MTQNASSPLGLDVPVYREIVKCCTVGLERLQQLMDAMTDEGVVIRQHVYRVRDARDAHLTVNRHRVIDWRLNDPVKHILVDLPTSQAEEFLKLQVTYLYTSNTCIYSGWTETEP